LIITKKFHRLYIRGVTKKGKEYFSYTHGLWYPKKTAKIDPSMMSPGPGDEHHKLPEVENVDVVAFIHSHADYSKETDLDFSCGRAGYVTGVYDCNLMNEFDDLDFYLLAPDGALLKTDAGSNLYQGTAIASGFYRSQGKYGLYKKGEVGYEWPKPRKGYFTKPNELNEIPDIDIKNDPKPIHPGSAGSNDNRVKMNKKDLQ